MFHKVPVGVNMVGEGWGDEKYSENGLPLIGLTCALDLYCKARKSIVVLHCAPPPCRAAVPPEYLPAMKCLEITTSGH